MVEKSRYQNIMHDDLHDEWPDYRCMDEHMKPVLSDIEGLTRIPCPDFSPDHRVGF